MRNKKSIISHVYASNPLNRGDRERRDEEWIARKSKDPTSKFLPLSDLDVLVSNGPDQGLGWLRAAELAQLGVDTRVIFLGLRHQEACFAVDVSGNVSVVRDLREGGKWRFKDAYAATENLSEADCGILAQARIQVDWHNRNGFCSICGHETFVKRGGQIRQCSNCDTEHFPRTDPVVITLVSDKDHCLLGQSRDRGFGKKMYSALAGFMDQGESIEEAVAREIGEEAGIQVENIRYHSSQPWPFPWSLMIGCHADAVTTDIVMDDDEMADVRWFQREEVLPGVGRQKPGPGGTWARCYSPPSD